MYVRISTAFDGFSRSRGHYAFGRLFDFRHPDWARKVQTDYVDFPSWRFDAAYSSVADNLFGIDLPAHSDGSVGVSQTDFISRMSELRLSDFAVGSKLILPAEKIRTRFRRILGSLVWLLQTQHQVSFAVTKFATESPYLCSQFDEVKSMVMAAIRIIQSVKAKPLVISPISSLVGFRPMRTSEA